MAESSRREGRNSWGQSGLGGVLDGLGPTFLSSGIFVYLTPGFYQVRGILHRDRNAYSIHKRQDALAARILAMLPTFLLTDTYVLLGGPPLPAKWPREGATFQFDLESIHEYEPLRQLELLREWPQVKFLRKGRARLSV